MAEEKKAFVAYVDWESQFNLLSDEEAGKLIKHIFSYVNDKNPEFEPSERLLIMAFEPIKKQLKRDLKKYEAIKKKRQEAGKKGGLKSGETRTETSKSEANEANASFAKQNEANEAVTVKDIVKDTVTVIVTDTVKESVINNIGNSPTQNFSFKQPIEVLKKNCAGHTTWLQSIGMKNSLLMPQVLEWFEAFCLHLAASGKTEETEQEFKRYCASWIASEVRQGRKPITTPPPEKKMKIDATTAIQSALIKKYGKQDSNA